MIRPGKKGNPTWYRVGAIRQDISGVTPADGIASRTRWHKPPRFHSGPGQTGQSTCRARPPRRDLNLDGLGSVYTFSYYSSRAYPEGEVQLLGETLPLETLTTAGPSPKYAAEEAAVKSHLQNRE
ncbi:hypothetical protein Taro_055400 [Colocasia esculenta]|uniref:Uncharacterized protein n=1 Tax=Colocasia esculenta TaxID=4460 RepID=A0A843XRA5_COLES|nr:hypothetical protein [Colocasia esculenta]